MDACGTIEVSLAPSKKDVSELATKLSEVAAATVLEVEEMSGRDIRPFQWYRQEAHMKNAQNPSRIIDHLSKVEKVIRKDKDWKELCCNPPKSTAATSSSSKHTSLQTKPFDSQASEPGPSQLVLSHFRDFFTRNRSTLPPFSETKLSETTLVESSLSVESPKKGVPELP